MVKVVTLLRRKPGMPVDEFQAYWRTRHPEVVRRLPGVRRYVQSHTLPAAYDTGEPLWDGIAEVWADDTDALRAMTRSADYARVQADEAVFLDRPGLARVVTEEHVITDGAVPPGAVKAVEFLTRRPGMAVDAFQRHWREVHGPIAARIPGVRRYVQSPTRRAAYEAGRVPAVDGLASVWFDSTDAIRRATAAPEYEAAAADRDRFLAPGPMCVILTTEHVVVE